MIEFTPRQQDIINAVIDIIADRGIQEFSMRTLAQRIGVSEPAIYRHFENKDEIHLKVIGYIGRHWEKFIRGLRWPDHDALDELENLCRFVFQKMEEIWPMTATLYSSAVVSDPKLLQEIFKTIEYATEHAAHIIQRGQEEKTIRPDIPSTVLASFFVANVKNVVEAWNLNGQTTDLLGEWQAVWDGMRKMFSTVQV